MPKNKIFNKKIKNIFYYLVNNGYMNLFLRNIEKKEGFYVELFFSRNETI